MTATIVAKPRTTPSTPPSCRAVGRVARAVPRVPRSRSMPSCAAWPAQPQLAAWVRQNGWPLGSSSTRQVSPGCSSGSVAPSSTHFAAAASRSSTARSRWNCLLPCSLGHPGSWWSLEGAEAEGHAARTGEHRVLVLGVRDLPAEHGRPEGRVARGVGAVEGEHLECRRSPWWCLSSGWLSAILPRLGRCPIGQRRHPRPRPRQPGCCGPTSSPGTSTSCASRSGSAAARWVENRWSLRWDLPPGRWFDSEVLPHPTCSLTVELGSHPRPGLPRGRGRWSSRGCAPAGSTSRCVAGAASWGCASAPAGSPRSPAGRPPRGPTARSRRPRCCPPRLVRALADPELAASGSPWAEAAERGLAALGDGAPTRTTTRCSTSSPTCSPTTRCCRWPRSPSGTA